MKLDDIPCNVYPHRGAEVTLLLPGRGMVRIAFGSGDNLDEEDRAQRDDNGHLIDRYVMIYEYALPPVDCTWTTPAELQGGRADAVDGLLFPETDGGEMMYSSRTFRGGDIRDLVVPALEFIEWPTDLSAYVLVDVSGAVSRRRKHPRGWPKPTKRKDKDGKDEG